MREHSPLLYFSVVFWKTYKNAQSLGDLCVCTCECMHVDVYIFAKYMILFTGLSASDQLSRSFFLYQLKYPQSDVSSVLAFSKICKNKDKCRKY